MIDADVGQVSPLLFTGAKLTIFNMNKFPTISNFQMSLLMEKDNIGKSLVKICLHMFLDFFQKNNNLYTVQ